MIKYKEYSWDDGTLTKEVLDSIKVGDKIRCNNWKQPLTVKAVSDNYFIMTDKKRYSICEKLPRKFTHNNAYKDRFTIGPDNYYGYYDYNDPTQCKEALLRLEDGYDYTPFANPTEHPNYFDWEKKISQATKVKGHLELGRAAVSLDCIYIGVKI